MNENAFVTIVNEFGGIGGYMGFIVSFVVCFFILKISVIDNAKKEISSKVLYSLMPFSCGVCSQSFISGTITFEIIAYQFIVICYVSPFLFYLVCYLIKILGNNGQKIIKKKDKLKSFKGKYGDHIIK